MSHSPHVLIFDSGVGGLTIAREVLAAFPQCRLSYASDNAFFPYGDKEPEWLIERVSAVMAELIERVRPDVIVIACNTASTLALPYLRERFAPPFVGVVPAIKPAAHMSRSKVIGVLATPATISRPYTHQLIQDYAADCQVLLHGSRDLVLQAERKLAAEPLDESILQREMDGLLSGSGAEALDTIVLACTHFPLIKKELALAALPRRFEWVDSGEAVARRVGYWIGQVSSRTAPCHLAHQVILTAPADGRARLEANIAAYLGRTCGAEAPLIVSPETP